MFTRPLIAEIGIALGLLASMPSCESDPRTAGETTNAAAEAISGGDTRDVTLSLLLPERAVGQLRRNSGPNDNGQCSSSVIARDTVLTAAHCFCRANKQSLDTSLNDFAFFLPLPASSKQLQLSVISIDLKYFNTVDSLCNTSSDEERAVSDLAIVKLQRSITVQELPQLEQIYTGGDFLDRSRNIPAQQHQFFSAPIEVVGFSGSQTSRKKGTVTSDINFELTCGLLGLGDCSAYWIDYNDNQTGAHHEAGDSGGPITYYFNGTAPTQFGVVKGIVRDLSGTEYTYSPTWDNGNGNGGFIRGFLPDGDNDGVEDASDNCPPSLCPYDVGACANPDQADRDGDGVGDICDNCDPTLCDARGWPVAACSNPDQADADHDGAGDECDSCVLAPNGATMHDINIFTQQLDDQDLDGVGDRCDNCDQPNGYAACQTSADCGGSACEASGKLGTCAGGSTPGTACGGSGSNFGECGGTGTCVSLGTNGRCAFQLDDLDHDGLGGQCDSCPNDPERDISTNSNDGAEQHLGAPAQGDICDAVPTYVSRPNLGETALPLSSTVTYTTFTSTAGIGHGGSTPFLGGVGFRYCSCFDGKGKAMDRASCLKLRCSPDSAAFNKAPGSSPWTTVSTATAGATTNGSFSLPDPSVAPVVDQRLNRFFNSTVLCSDIEVHPTDSPADGNCRVGQSEEILKWFHDADIGRGVIPVDGNGHSAGIFWSHVLVGSIGYASPRDSTWTGQLRDNHEYVFTPFVGLPSLPPQGSVPQPCRVGGCVGWWNPKWAIDPAESVAVNPTPLVQIGRLARLESVNQSVVARRGDGSGIDVTSSLSDAVRTAITTLSGQVSWLSPIEPPGRGRLGPSLVGAAIATPWRQSAFAPVALDVRNDTLEIANALNEGGGGIDHGSNAALATTAFVPADRDGSRALFSSREKSVYLLGGHFLSGQTTQEVWKFDFSTQSWNHTFLLPQDGTGSPQIGDILALTYDDVNRRILAFDELSAPVTTDRRHREDHEREHLEKRSKLLVFDTKSQKISAVMTLPRGGTFQRVSLATQDDGSYILVGALDRHWLAFRFELDARRPGEQHVRWTGVAEGNGVVLDDPVRVDGGNVLPVARGDKEEFVLLSNALFNHDGRGCNAL